MLYAVTVEPLLIGRRDSADPRDSAVDGRIDEVAIWNRALSTGEVASLWNNGNGMLINSVPEPTSILLLGMAGTLWGSAYAYRRRRTA